MRKVNTISEFLQGGVRTLLCVFVFVCAGAQLTGVSAKEYRCELGVQGGCGYYVGDATEHVFQNVREAYGAQFRYLFDSRWSLAVKGMGHRICGGKDDLRTTPVEGDGTKWVNQMANLDVMAEYNFLRLGLSEHDYRVKPYTPFIGLGVGVSLYSDFRQAACYIPVSLGFRWKFASRWAMSIAWQHNVYLADNLEGIDYLGNTHNLNGSNIMNMDITSQLTFGIVFAFAERGKVCRMCLY